MPPHSAGNVTDCILHLIFRASFCVVMLLSEKFLVSLMIGAQLVWWDVCRNSILTFRFHFDAIYDVWACAGQPASHVAGQWCKWWFEIWPLIMWGHPHDLPGHVLIILEVKGCLYKNKGCPCKFHAPMGSHEYSSKRTRGVWSEHGQLSTDAVTGLAHEHQMASRSPLDYSPSLTHVSKQSYVLTRLKIVHILICPSIGCFWDMVIFVSVASWSVGISLNNSKINILVVGTHHQESNSNCSVAAFISALVYVPV